MSNQELIKKYLEDKAYHLSQAENCEKIVNGLRNYERLKHPEKVSKAVIEGESSAVQPGKKGTQYGRIIRKIFDTRNQILSITEIYNILEQKLEDKIGTAKKIKIGQALSNLKVIGDLKSKDFGSKENRVWGLSKMFDEKGEIKEKYKRPDLIPEVEHQS